MSVASPEGGMSLGVEQVDEKDGREGGNGDQIPPPVLSLGEGGLC